MPKKRVLAVAIAAALSGHTFEGRAQSIAPTTLPTGGRVVGGQASISQSGASMAVQQTTTRAALDWQSFNIGSQAAVRFDQPSASSIALNQVLGNNASQIYGSLTANGQVFLMNPNGVLFGRGAQVDVGGLLASTLKMNVDDFMRGANKLLSSGGSGAIVNEGKIKTGPGGYVAFVGPTLRNDGAIESPSGTVSLTAANAATLEYMADGLVRIRVDEKAVQSEVTNNGVITADGGGVFLNATALDSLARAVVNNTGVIEARTVENVNGVVRLGGGEVTVSGVIDASGASGTGGSINVLGDKVALTGSARLDASGAAGGGEVLVGGNYQGKGPEQNAYYAYVGKDVTIDASAKAQGDGGRVIVWSNEGTQFHGSITARGGALGGSGGFVETSGDTLQVTGKVDTSAPNGRVGTWLLDPKFIEVAESTGSAYNAGINNLFGNNSTGTSIITPSSISSSSGTVLLQANTDITFTDPIAMTAPSAGLTAQAGRSILVNANVSTNNGNISLTANDPSATSNRDPGAGGIIMAAGTIINAGSGDVRLTVSTGIQAGDVIIGSLIGGRVGIVHDALDSFTNILRADSSSLVTANQFFIDSEKASIGNPGAPLQIAPSTPGGTVALEAHYHYATAGIFIDSPNAGSVQIGGVDQDFFGGLVRGVQAGDGVNGGSGPIRITVDNGSLFTLAGGAGCGLTGLSGGPICGNGGGITLTASGSLGLAHTVNAGAGNVFLTAGTGITSTGSGAINGDQLLAQGGSGGVDLTGSNAVNTIAGSTTSGHFHFSNTQALTIGTVNAVSGITTGDTTNGDGTADASVSISALSILGSGAITTGNSSGTGGANSSIGLTANAGVSVGNLTTGTVTTSSLDAQSSVNISASGGVITGSITTGNADSPNGNADSSLSISGQSILTGAIQTGSASQGGLGNALSYVYLNATGNVFVGGSITTGDATGGYADSSVSVSTDPGDITVTGGITTGVTNAFNDNAISSVDLEAFGGGITVLGPIIASNSFAQNVAQSSVFLSADNAIDIAAVTTGGSNGTFADSSISLTANGGDLTAGGLTGGTSNGVSATNSMIAVNAPAGAVTLNGTVIVVGKNGGTVNNGDGSADASGGGALVMISGNAGVTVHGSVIAGGGDGGNASGIGGDGTATGGGATVTVAAQGPILVDSDVTAIGGPGGVAVGGSQAVADGGNASVSVHTTSGTTTINGVVAAQGGNAGSATASISFGAASALGGVSNVGVGTDSGNVFVNGVQSFGGTGGSASGISHTADGGSAGALVSTPAAITVGPGGIAVTGGDGGVGTRTGGSANLTLAFFDGENYNPASAVQINGDLTATGGNGSFGGGAGVNIAGTIVTATNINVVASSGAGTGIHPANVNITAGAGGINWIGGSITATGGVATDSDDANISLNSAGAINVDSATLSVFGGNPDIELLATGPVLVTNSTLQGTAAYEATTIFVNSSADNVAISGSTFSLNGASPGLAIHDADTTNIGVVARHDVTISGTSLSVNAGAGIGEVLVYAGSTVNFALGQIDWAGGGNLNLNAGSSISSMSGIGPSHSGTIGRAVLTGDNVSIAASVPITVSTYMDGILAIDASAAVSIGGNLSATSANGRADVDIAGPTFLVPNAGSLDLLPGSTINASGPGGTTTVSAEIAGSITIGGNINTSGQRIDGSPGQGGIFLTAGDAIIGAGGILNAAATGGPSPDAYISLQAVNGIGTVANPIRLGQQGDFWAANTGTTVGDVAISLVSGDVNFNPALGDNLNGYYTNAASGTYLFQLENGNLTWNGSFRPNGFALLAGQSVQFKTLAGNITMGSGSSIQTFGTGNITLDANNTTANGSGVFLSGVSPDLLTPKSQLLASGTGNVSVIGTSAHGAGVFVGGDIDANGGNISITGTGATVGGSGSNTVAGVTNPFVSNDLPGEWNPAIPRLHAGSTITITGTGGTTTGNGSAAGVGFGGSFTGGNFGHISMDGELGVSITGTGGASATGGAAGVAINSGSSDTVNGGSHIGSNTGVVAITGHAGTAGGNPGGNAIGVTIGSGSDQVNTNVGSFGQITINGFGGTGHNINGTSNNVNTNGVALNRATIESTGGITIYGEGGTATVDNAILNGGGTGVGILNSTVQTALAGNILITGLGRTGAGVGNAAGVGISDGAVIQTQGIDISELGGFQVGTGSITINGTGGGFAGFGSGATGTGGANGISVSQFNTTNGGSILSNTGAITLNGQGGTAVTGESRGIVLRSNGGTITTVESTGGAAISLTGIGGNSAATGTNSTSGVVVTSSSLVRTAGDLGIDGTGGINTGPTGSSGVGITDSAIVAALGAGNLSIHGQGGSASAGAANGILIGPFNTTFGSTVSTDSGTLALTGLVGSASAPSAGVRVNDSNVFTVTGPMNISVTGDMAVVASNTAALNTQTLVNSGGTQSVVVSGALTLQGAATGNNAPARLISSGNQSIDAGSITLHGGDAGGADGSGNYAQIVAIGGTQTITTAADMSLTGGAAGVNNFAAVLAPTQNITVHGNLSLTGGGSDPTTVGAGSRIGGLGGASPTQTNLTLQVDGNTTLTGGSNFTGATGSSIGASFTAVTPQSTNITATIGGDLVMTQGSLSGTTFGSPTSNNAGGNTTVNATNISMTGGNLIHSSGGLFINASGDITVMGGSGTNQSPTIQSDGGQVISAATISVIGGAAGTGNMARIYQTGASANQTVTAGTISIFGGADGGGSGTGNFAQIRNDGLTETVNVGAGGLHLTGGGGSLTDNSASVIQSNSLGTQSIQVTGGGAIALQGGSSVGQNVGAGHGSYASIQSAGTQDIDFVSPGSIGITGGTVGSNNFALIGAAGNQSITGSPAISMLAGANGGVVNESNDAKIGSNTSQSVIAGPVTITGGGGVSASAGFRAPSQSITVNGNLVLNGGSDPDGGARIGSSSGVATSLSLLVNGDLTLNGGTSGAALGSHRDFADANDLIIHATGNIALNAGVGSGVRIGSSSANPAGGNINVTADGSLSLNGSAAFGTAIRTLGDATVTAGQLSITDSTITSGNAGIGDQHINVTNALLIDANGQGSSISSSGVQTVSAGSIVIDGGTVVGKNAGIFNNTGNQTVSVGGTITLTGGTAPGASGVGCGPTGGSCALIANSGAGLQSISANAVTMTGGSAGTANNAGFFVSGGPEQITVGAGGLAMLGGAGAEASSVIGSSGAAGQTLTINVSGNTALTGGSGTTAAALIGLGGTGDSNPVTVNFGGSGNLTLTAGSGTNAAAVIGAASTQTNAATSLNIVAADIALNDSASTVSRFGHSGSAPGGGDINVTATSGNIALNSANALGSAIRTLGNVTMTAAGAISEGPQSLVATPNLLVANASSGISMNGNNTVGQLLASNNASGDIQFTQAAGNLLTVNGLTEIGGNVIITADDLNITGGVNAGANTVMLRPTTLSQNIALQGGDIGGALSLSNADLSFITAGSLEIGRNDNTGVGTMTISSLPSSINVPTIKFYAQDINWIGGIGGTGSEFAHSLEVRASNNVSMIDSTILLADGASLAVVADNDSSGVGNLTISNSDPIGHRTILAGTSAGNSASMLLQGQNISVTDTAGTTMTVNLRGTGTQVINAAGTLTVQGGAIQADEGTQTVTTPAVSVLSAGTFGHLSGGSQTINATAILVQGGGGVGNNASIEQMLPSGTQTINIAAGGSLTVQGGAGAAGGNDAAIRSQGTLQQINFAAGGTLQLLGGANGTSNRAHIRAENGDLVVAGAPNIVLQGGTGGQDNSANLDAFGTLTVSAGNITLTGGSGVDAHAAMGGATSNIAYTGAVQITGGTGNGAFAGIGSGESDVAITLAGAAGSGTVNLTGGSGGLSSDPQGGAVLGADAIIGAVGHAADVSIFGQGDINLSKGGSSGFGARIGSDTAGGNVLISAGQGGSGALVMVGGQIRTLGDVTLQANGDIVFYGASLVANNLTLSPTGVTLIPFGQGTTTFATTSPFNNTGTLVLASGAVLSTNGGDLVNTSTGVIFGDLNGPGIFSTNTSTIDLGGGTLTNNGIVRPGGAGVVGTLAITGNYAQGATGSLEMDLASASSYDVLAVSGSAALNGTLNAATIGGFTPNGDSFAVLTYGSRSGSFATLNLPTNVLPTYNLADLTLTHSLTGGEFWTNTFGDFLWTTAGNWSLNRIPVNTDDVTLAVSAGSEARVTSGTHTITSLTSTANNSLLINGGSLTVTGSANLLGTTTVQSGALTLQGNSALAGTAMSGGNLNIGTSTSAAALTWTGGTIGGGGVLTVLGALDMPAGQCSNCWNHTFLTGTTLNANGTTTFGSGQNFGGNGADLTLSSGAIVNNNGTWALDYANIIGATGTEPYNNLNTLNTGASGFGGTITAVLNNSGTVNINGDGLGVTNGGTSSGAFNIGAGATLNLANGTSALNGAVSGPSGLLIVGSTATAQVNGAVNVGQLNLSGLLNGTGNVNVTNSYTQSGVVNLGGALSITQASGGLGLGAINAGSLTLASAGPITQSGPVVVAGATSINAGANAVILTNAGNDFQGVVTAAGNGISISDANALTISLTDAGATTLTAGSITLTGSVQSASLTAAAAGALTNTGSATINVTGPAHFSGGTIDLGNQLGDSVSLGSLTYSSGGSVSISQDTAMVVTGSNAAGSLTLASAGAITDAAGTSQTIASNAAFTGTSITLADNSGDSLTVGGNASFTAVGGGAIDIGSLGNISFGSLTFNTTGPASFKNCSGLQLAGSSSAGALTVACGGGLTNVASASLNVAGNANLSGTSIDLGNQSGDAINLGSLTYSSAGTVSISTDSALAITGSSSAGNLTLASAGAISNAAGASQLIGGNATFAGASVTLAANASDVLSVGGTATFNGTGGGAVSIPAAGTVNFGAVAFNTAGAVSISEDSATQLTGSSTAGSLTLVSAGALGNASSATLAVAGNANLAGTSINLGNQSGDLMSFGSVTFNSAGAVNVAADSAMALAGSSTGSSVILAATAITGGAGSDLATMDLTLTTVNGVGTLLTHVGTPSLEGALTVTNSGAGNVDVQNVGLLNLRAVTNSGGGFTLDNTGNVRVSTAANTAGAFNITAHSNIDLQANITANTSGTASPAIDLQAMSPGSVITQNAGTTLDGNNGAVLLSAAGGVTLQGTTTGGSLSATTSGGAVQLGTTTTTGSLSVSTSGGDITQSGTLSIGGTSSLQASTGSVDLATSSNTFTGAVSATGTGTSGITIVTSGTLIPATINAGTSTIDLAAGSLSAGGPITGSSATLGSNTDVTGVNLNVGTLTLTGTATNWSFLTDTPPTVTNTGLTVTFTPLTVPLTAVTTPPPVVNDIISTISSTTTSTTTSTSSSSTSTTTTAFSTTLVPDASAGPVQIVSAPTDTSGSSTSTSTTSSATSSSTQSVDTSADTSSSSSQPQQTASVQRSTTTVAPSGRPLTAAAAMLVASMNELRSQKAQALEKGVEILERNPAAADLKSCAGNQLAGDCIAERPAKLRQTSYRQPAQANLPQIQRKVALLIGVSDYRGAIPKLNSPVKDIQEIGKIYREQFGYEVRTLPNADKATIVRALNRLILESGPNDSVTVFYAGHGQLIEKTGRGYWIPARASADDPTQWISNQDIGKALGNMAAKQVLLVSDSCYSGTLTRDAKVRRSELLTDPNAILEKRSVTVLSSGGEEPVADAGRDGHSVFAWHFMQTLRGVEKLSNGVDVYERLTGNVTQDFPQEPQYGEALGSGHERGGDFLFEVRHY